MGFHYTKRIGRLEIGWWNDTGKPLFRLCFHKNKPAPYAVNTYSWYFKAFLYKRTLWIAWFNKGK